MGDVGRGAGEQRRRRIREGEEKLGEEKLEEEKKEDKGGGRKGRWSRREREEGR